MLVTCPSGLSFQARPWKIGDRRHLHDKQTLRQGLLMRKMLETIDSGVENPGPYQFAIGKPVPWSDACFSDIIDALVSVRIATKPVMDYDEICQQCGKKIPITIDLRELERFPMHTDGMAYLTSGAPIVRDINTGVVAADGRDESVRLHLHMYHGKDLPRLANFYRQEPREMPEIQMVMHIASVDTADGQTINDFRKLREWYSNQSWDFHSNLDAEIAKFTGGVNTQVSMVCDGCNAEQETPLPFAAEFFYPKQKQSVSSMATL